ncbi:MAG: plasmid-partitioning protein, partial [Gorillibacterium sp.]|nr:plasmid-partitioning protein [Gorillibacterium sp.]
YWKSKLKEDLEKEIIKAGQLQSGYLRAKEELEALKLQQTDDLDEKQQEALMKKLRYEADTNTIQFSIHVKQFLQKASLTSFNLAALASASNAEKKRLLESLDMLETFIENVRPSINSRKVVEGNVITQKR